MKDNKDKKLKTHKRSQEAAKAFTSKSSFKSDPFGSYTGQTKDEDEKPVQDADDL